MPSPEESAQPLRELFAQLDDIVAFGFEQLQKRAQVRHRQRQVAAVKRPLAVHQLVYAATDVLRVSLAQLRMVMQVLTSRRL